MLFTLSALDALPSWVDCPVINHSNRLTAVGFLELQRATETYGSLLDSLFKLKCICQMAIQCAKWQCNPQFKWKSSCQMAIQCANGNAIRNSVCIILNTKLNGRLLHCISYWHAFFDSLFKWQFNVVAKQRPQSVALAFTCHHALFHAKFIWQCNLSVPPSRRVPTRSLFRVRPNPTLLLSGYL